MVEHVFEQKRSQHRTRITLDEASFTSYLEDQHHASTIHMEYEELPFETREHTEKVQPARAAAIFLVGYTFVGLVSYWLGGNSFLALSPAVAVFQLLLAGVFEGAYRLTKADFTVFDTYKGSVTVIDDENKEKILSELNSRRNEQIRERHGEVDKLAHPEAERRRFMFLLEKGVIDQMRYKQAMEEINDGEIMPLPSPNVPPTGTLH